MIGIMLCWKNTFILQCNSKESQEEFPEETQILLHFKNLKEQ